MATPLLGLGVPTSFAAVLLLAASPAAAAVPLYPDLLCWSERGAHGLFDVEIVVVGGRKRLRFTTAIANRGPGPFQLEGAVDGDGTTVALQRVFNDDGTFTDRPAGTFQFSGHQGHNHFHFAEFADYWLRAVGPGGSVGATLAKSDKVGFAMWDVAPYDRTLPGAPQTAFYTRPASVAPADQTQGISVGWADVYERTLGEQFIDVTGVPDGAYWLEVVIDPNDRLAESDETNNKTWMRLAIAGNTVTTFDDQPPAPTTFVSLTFDDIRGSQRTARGLLDARGLKATFYANSGRVGVGSSLTLAELRALAAAGHEIGGHTIDHADLTALSEEERRRQVCDDRAALVGWGLDPVSFAYPFGAYDAAAEATVAACGYSGARTTGGVGCPTCPAGETRPPQDPYAIIAPGSIRETDTLADLQKYVTDAEAADAWLILTFHDVDNPGTFNISSATLAAFLDWLKDREALGTVVRTVRQVLGAPVSEPPAPSTAAVFFDPFSYPDGLVTNENASSPRSDRWLVTDGSLFASGGQGWTGVPDTVTPNAASSNGTGSAFFRALTQSSAFATEVNLKLTVQAFPLSGAAWDGAHVFLRWQDPGNYYYVSVHRRDGRAAIKKRANGTTSTFTTPFYGPPLGVQQDVQVTAENNADGSVTIKLHVDGVLRAQATDSSAPFTAPGKVGMAGENAQFLFDDFAVGGSSAPPPPPGDTFVQSVVVSGLQSPTAMAFSPDGRLFVCEQAGRLRVIKDGALLSTPFLTLNVNPNGERGLLGVAFDPAFAVNRFLYLYYTTSAGRNRLSRFRADASNPDVVEAGSEAFLIEDIGLPSANHNGGVIHFGADGKLYVGVGDHGSSANAQDLGVLAGKLLRLDPAAYPDIIPPDNPFVGQAGARGEVWALGLRNPYTFNVDPVSGTIHVNDVGEATYEEVNLGARGANYGWPACEGPCASPQAGLTDPHYFYAQGPGCAITGGAFYRGGRFPARYEGAYFFADYCGNFVKALFPDKSAADFASGFGAPVDLQAGPDGALYVLEYSAGEVTRISHTGPGVNRPPTVSASAAPPGGPAPLTVTFSAAADDPDGDLLGYAWDFGDGSFGFGPSTSHVYGSTGAFLVRVIVTDGRGGLAADELLVVSGSELPGALITLPGEGTYYAAGATIPFAGMAADPEDGELPPSAYSWKVVFHHEDHTHPFLGPLEGVTSGSFVIPTVGETSTDVWHRVHLTVRDSSGLLREVTRDVLPSTMTLTVATVPPGLTVTLDGIPRSAPFAAASVVGMRRVLGAPAPQTFGGRVYEFVSWSDGGAASHEVTAPAGNAAYTATFREQAAAFSDSFDYPDGLVTNENPASPRSPKWLVTEGSLFASGGQGWTGVPDTVSPNADSSNGTGSALFRALTQPSNFATELTFKLTVEGFPLPGAVWDGAHVYLRYQDTANYYYVSVQRRDGRAAIKKRRLGTVSTFTTPFYGPPLGVQQDVKVTAVNNADGSVTLELYVNGVLRARAVDSISPITSPGKVGMAGENTRFRFDDFTVDGVPPPPAPQPPVLSALSPSSAPAGGPGFTLSVFGQRFSTASVVRWNGSGRETTFVSASTLTAAVPASDLVAAGSVPVTVFDPAGASNALAFTIVSTAPAPAAAFFDGFDYPDGLVTNENPSSPRSAKWLVTEGSLFASGGRGWTGVPDTVSPDATSSNGTGSALFRALTQGSDFATEVTFKLTVEAFPLSGAVWDGVHVFLRWRDGGNYYWVSVHRRDGRAGIKKRTNGTTSTFTTPFYGPPLGVEQDVRVSAENNPDGSVTIRLFVDGVLRAQATDTTSPFTAPGKVGVAGENVQFRFDDFTIDPAGGAGPAAVASLAGPPASSIPEAFVLRDLYAFPNPSRGGARAVFRIQVGLADSVELNVYDVSGRRVHSASFGAPAVLDDGNGKGPQYTFDHPWDTSSVGSGVYIGVITARKAGQPVLRQVVRVAVIQ